MVKPLKFVPLDLYGSNTNREKPVLMIARNGDFACFPSVRAASRMMGIPEPNIIACLKGRLKTAGGYCWKYEDDFCSYGERKDQ